MFTSLSKVLLWHPFLFIRKHEQNSAGIQQQRRADKLTENSSSVSLSLEYYEKNQYKFIKIYFRQRKYDNFCMIQHSFIYITGKKQLFSEE